MNKTKNVQSMGTNRVASDQNRIRRERVTKGLLMGLGILAMLAFWGTFVYAIWVRNMELVMIFVYIIAIGGGVFGTIHFLSKLREHISKS